MRVFDVLYKPKVDYTNKVIHGDCVEAMRQMPDGIADFILTDPPYLVNYRDRDGRRLANDTGDGAFLFPAFKEAYRVLKPDTFAVSFYGWQAVDIFMRAWKLAGFRPVGHLVFKKDYSSNQGAVQYAHESAFLLAKGNPKPIKLIPDVLGWQYTGNKYHPTQKPEFTLEVLVDAFSPLGGLVLDPFMGSGSSLIAARERGRKFCGIDVDDGHVRTALQRLQG